MTVTLELTHDQERRVLESAERHDRAAVLEVLNQAIEAAVEKLMRKPLERADKEPFDALADELVTAFAASTGGRSLPDEALTREGIYGSHP